MVAYFGSATEMLDWKLLHSARGGIQCSAILIDAGTNIPHEVRVSICPLPPQEVRIATCADWDPP
ncbi:hypothetical protein Gxy13693_046_016 [Komagataeibacter xylinus NBRC 13693]|uniref:Uncharacterized protein n=1 Tax=Komagataeibacter xylinus NBRC 13693 TaxID=1234668 RepID=A0A0D6QAE2_KOMXY|nr:hypothetical protein Gxy13693_046_016 [Komagataeibacter xylinus NBRC 13693]